MRLELLHIDECPNTVKAYERLEEALRALGRAEVEVHVRLLESAADIQDTGFAGSPTITVDGVDIFPGGAPASELSCRIYMTPRGFAGLPTTEQLTEALGNSGI